MRLCACGCGTPIRPPARKWAPDHRTGDPGPVLLSGYDDALDLHSEITFCRKRLAVLWLAARHELAANQIWLAEHPTDEPTRLGTAALAAACRHAARRIRGRHASVRLDHLLALVLAALTEVAASADEPLLDLDEERARLEELQDAIQVALRSMGLVSA